MELSIYTITTVAIFTRRRCGWILLPLNELEDLVGRAAGRIDDDGHLVAHRFHVPKHVKPITRAARNNPVVASGFLDERKKLVVLSAGLVLRDAGVVFQRVIANLQNFAAVFGDDLVKTALDLFKLEELIGGTNDLILLELKSVGSNFLICSIPELAQ